MYPQNFILGVLFILASELMFATMATLIKLLAISLPNESIVFFRNAIVMLLLLPWIIHDGLDKLNTQQFRLHALRSIAGLAGMYCFFYTIGHMPLAESVLLFMTAPFFIPMISSVWLKEVVTPMTIGAIILGFVGVAVILKPGSATFSTVALVAISGGLLAAVVKTTIRRMSNTEPSERIVFYFSVIGTIISAIPLWWSWVTPTWQVWLLLIIMSLFAAAGQLLMTRAYMLAPASEIGAFSYASVIFASLYGWFFWQEVIDKWFFIGAGLVFVAGVLIAYNHRSEVSVKTTKPLSDIYSEGTVK